MSRWELLDQLQPGSGWSLVNMDTVERIEPAPIGTPDATNVSIMFFTSGDRRTYRVRFGEMCKLRDPK